MTDFNPPDPTDDKPKGDPFMRWTITLDDGAEEAHDVYTHNTHTAQLFMEKMISLISSDECFAEAYNTTSTTIPTTPTRPDPA